jgi:hypothetical protein
VIAPRGCRGVQNTGYLIRFSANSEYTSNTLSEPREWLLRASATPSNKRYSRNLTEDSRASSLTCLQPWHRPSRSGDPEVPTTRRVGPEGESESRSNRLALYRTSYLDCGDRLPTLYVIVFYSGLR